MKYEDIVSNLSQIKSFDSQYLLFKTDQDTVYYGRNAEGQLVFAIESLNVRLPRFMQQTNSLSFCFNEKGTFLIDGNQETRIIHLLICKDNEAAKEDAFIRLTNAFSMKVSQDDPYYVAKLFSALSSLFDKHRVSSDIELQGLYGELFTMLFFQEHGCDISCFWHSKDRMTFDFNISSRKRLEVKTTIRQDRTHHFKHNQLMSRTNEVRVVSIMLKESDVGLSLMSIIEQIRDLYQNNYDLMLHIDTLISGHEEDELDQFMFDEDYLRSNIKLFDAKDIPHFDELAPDGVFNAEYDSCLTNVRDADIDEVIQWIGEGAIIYV